MFLLSIIIDLVTEIKILVYLILLIDYTRTMVDFDYWG